MIAVCVWILNLAAYAFVVMFCAVVALWTVAAIFTAVSAWRRRRDAARDDWMDIIDATRERRSLTTCADCQFWDAAGDRPAYVPCVIHDEAYWQQLGSEVTS